MKRKRSDVSFNKLKAITHQVEVEEDLTKTYDENPYTNSKFENQWTTQNAKGHTFSFNLL